ncbi:MAG: hypothetical protein K2O17_07845 [Bacteroidaceae bacterium]|nr:hypothetical protein [Bacteroidaceae bacterium]
MNDFATFNLKLETVFDNLVESLRTPDSLSYAFWLSVSLLLLISLLKYFMAKNSERRDWGNFILELPIDVCLVVITIIITGYMQGTNLAIGVLLVVLSLIMSVVCCIFRRKSINHSYDEGKKILMLVYGFLDIFIACAWISFVYVKII